MQEGFIRGRHCYLRPFRQGDEISIAQWLNDPVTTHLLFYGQRPVTIEQARSFIQGHIQNERNVVLIICDTESNNAVGFTGLYDIHETARKAEFRILIGEEKARGRGIGKEVVQLLTAYAFDRLNLNRVWLGVVAENYVAVFAYEKAGYVREGILRQELYRNSQYYDVIRMSILRSEFKTQEQGELS